MAPRLGTLSYWAASGAAIYFFLSSAFCVAVILGFVRGESADAEFTAILCFVLGFAMWTCGGALRVLLTDRW